MLSTFILTSFNQQQIYMITEFTVIISDSREEAIETGCQTERKEESEEEGRRSVVFQEDACCVHLIMERPAGD